jgi:hypothetical protein
MAVAIVKAVKPNTTTARIDPDAHVEGAADLSRENGHPVDQHDVRRVGKAASAPLHDRAILV